MYKLFSITSLLQFLQLGLDAKIVCPQMGKLRSQILILEFGFRFGNEVHTLDLETNKLWDFAFGFGNNFKALIWVI